MTKLTVSATLSEGLTATAQNSTITLQQTTVITTIDASGNETIHNNVTTVTLSYMDVTNFVAFARAAGWKSERKSRE